VQGESGILLANGTADAPAKVGIPITDQIAGAHAAVAIVAALYRRQHTGEGAYLDVSMLESAVFWLAYYPHNWWHRSEEPPRSGMRHQYLCPYGPFPAADGRLLNVVVASDADWHRFCDVVERPEWASDRRFATVAGRSQARRSLNNLVEGVIRTKSVEEWGERFQALGLPYGFVRPIEEVLEHPQLLARGLFTQAESPVGKLPLIRFPLGGLEHREVPSLGQHSAAILAEAGYDRAQIEELRSKRIV
jgi:crotonobetainyl-CoA:carnitine CoA-transferase CaiB-like acyl-CoA transferase